jgi:hypothetical protein
MRRTLIALSTIWATTGFVSEAAAQHRLAMACGVQPPVVTAMCPALKTYSAQQQSQLVREMTEERARNSGSMMLRVITDCYALREACRAQQAKK